MALTLPSGSTHRNRTSGRFTFGCSSITAGEATAARYARPDDLRRAAPRPHRSGRPATAPLPGVAVELLAALAAPPRLGAHLRLVHDVAWHLTAAFADRFAAVPFDRQAVLFGAAVHDLGKVEHPAELTGPGSAHEEAGYQLLLRFGVPEERARFAVTHAAWHSPACSWRTCWSASPTRCGRAAGSPTWSSSWSTGSPASPARSAGRRSWTSTTCSPSWPPARTAGWRSRPNIRCTADAGPTAAMSPASAAGLPWVGVLRSPGGSMSTSEARGRVRAFVTVSLDGYVTGPDDHAGQGLGVGGERMHHWVMGGPWTYDTPREPGTGMTGEDRAYFDELLAGVGAALCGRGMYDSAGAWGGRNPFEAPLVVLTHPPPTSPTRTPASSWSTGSTRRWRRPAYGR
ncbi:HD domain-containing protein [Micromonospora sp. BRA006-A]|nr:HD domain-containing protein [Micromonospora sp. BRA006-A]